MTSTTDILTQERAHIDTIDAQIMHLLEERVACAERIGQEKTRQGRPSKLDPQREQQVLAHMCALNTTDLPDESIRNIFNAIMTACRELQERQEQGKNTKQNPSPIVRTTQAKLPPQISSKTTSSSLQPAYS